MSRYIRSVICTVFLLASLVSAPFSLASSKIENKPNIVLVLMDNFGYGEVGVYGGGVLRGAATPNIDSIAAQGFQLTNFNVEAECTPSRAALMTGRYGIRTRQKPSGPPRGVWYGITKWEITLAEMLSDSGYATGIFGKWHLGDTKGRYPTDQGFDEWYGIPRSSDRAFWPDSTSFAPGSHPKAVFTYVMSAKRGEQPKPLDVYNRAKRTTIDGEITDMAIDFIKRKAKAKQPFFAYIPYTQTHEPVDPHPDFKGKTGNGKFADVLAQTDAYVGKLLATVDELKLKNTIFIFTSDNGREGVPRSFGFTGPWRGSMFSPYEGSLRVPFLVRWPEKIPTKQVSNDIVHQIDLFPTLANWVGAELPKDRVIDGVNQSNFFMGKSEKSARESMVIYIGNELFGVKWRNWKLLLKEIDEHSYAIKKMAYPTIYNLLIDPKEEVPELNYLSDTWVDFPLYQVLDDHIESIENDAGAPNP
ncbi:sulfatase-like hydrolase/transferase [Thalassotalea psychrophila]|uniref:Sulfatase-like hydrolase/transferase n=1 Tax=Thalassotalea psychrophila TaxID=3065647 RepID=A0ABY9TTD4_9GAMM|nr:sulfatase-like hydrolase/transferase [Colwelliaceae bacterium SQ149]